MPAEKSLPKLRFATFCKLVLGNPSSGSDLSLIGLLPEINANITHEPETEPPDLVELHIQNMTLFASFDAPEKFGELLSITATVTTEDTISVKLDPTVTNMKLDPSQKILNMAVRLDGFSIRSIPVRADRYIITAKWKVDNVTVARLDLPFNVLVTKPL